MEKIISGNDVYFLQVFNNKIIINDNYEGIIILDHEINVLRKIKLFEGIYIYSSFVIGENEFILFCPEDNNVVYVDIEKNQVYIIDVPADIENEVFRGVILNNRNRCIFVTNKNKYIVLDKNKKALKRVNVDSQFDKFVIKSESEIFKSNNNILQMYNDCNNRDVRDNTSVVTYEDRIIMYNNQEVKEIFPKDGYIFNNAKIMNINKHLYLVILSNKKDNDEISILSVININNRIITE